ncbi:acetyltransferase [Xenorhabdus bovienii]|uniref:Putative acyltransferase n=1 Tax=Xenorhabdus bovienii str. kraussei Becker Underwood TaxID=1398204 RepID=A0A077PDI3_XENBV|nr:acetyltransferase [Xenorhabdus bovienii]MCG3470037.1 acetyltransferase [Xenorhabdus bovienii]MDE9550055.1 acetyltransferase [Xenorhabdus bovienii]MDE9563875.1 acetyltransferase [Xenorhabdus bovienii]CDG87351.1 putative acyltransferase [Xenorhabdus bovienii str. feltiae France]CDG90885.1 putative acyltransferase [Xenorhabdus bovienii str. feltiae Florida]
MYIKQATETDFAILIQIWEASVRATHDFLPETIIEELRPLILNDYLPNLIIYKAVNDQHIIEGFVAVDQQRVEMLFISPQARGKGIGKMLLAFAMTELQINELDVNEQNEQGVGFYKHMGFQVFARSEVDGQGNPFPLLHMKLA